MDFDKEQDLYDWWLLWQCRNHKKKKNCGRPFKPNGRNGQSHK